MATRKKTKSRRNPSRKSSAAKTRKKYRVVNYSTGFEKKYTRKSDALKQFSKQRRGGASLEEFVPGQGWLTLRRRFVDESEKFGVSARKNPARRKYHVEFHKGARKISFADVEAANVAKAAVIAKRKLSSVRGATHFVIHRWASPSIPLLKMTRSGAVELSETLK